MTPCDASKGSCSLHGEHHEQHHEEHECCDLNEKMFCLADEAWKELLMEKIKQEIEKLSGEKLNEVAKAVAEANHKRWHHMMEGKQKCCEFKQHLKDLLMK